MKPKKQVGNVQQACRLVSSKKGC